MKSHSRNSIFVRPLWRGFAIAPPVTAFVYITTQILLSTLGLIDYQGPLDEADYIREPAIIAISFVFLSIAFYVTTFLCGLPLIYILKRCHRLSIFSLILSATVLGAVVLPVEVATAVVLFDGKVSNFGAALTWMIAVGAASGCFTAYVFQTAAGMSDGVLSNPRHE